MAVDTYHAAREAGLSPEQAGELALEAGQRIRLLTAPAVGIRNGRIEEVE
jgi:hypothetical protein